VSRADFAYLGPYRLLSTVNTGHTTRVWQALHDREEKVYAIKALLDSLRNDRVQKASLKWEYTVGSEFDVDRIVRMTDFGLSRGIPYIAMEWIPWLNLKNRIRQGIPALTPLIPKIVVQAVEALAQFNMQGWVHRDIKPDNFLVSDEGDVKLIDFALAQRRPGKLAWLFSRKPKVLQGTRSYMSPEQIRGKPMDERADLYSLGCTFFELVSGRTPFTGSSTNELLSRHLKMSPPGLQAMNRSVTPEFADLVHRMLAKRPDSRPKSAVDVLGELTTVSIFKHTYTPPTK
jgi:serine/threonine protein kinase